VAQGHTPFLPPLMAVGVDMEGAFVFRNPLGVFAT